jgi:crossover junction endodeoxyribonuclease RusA
VEYTFAIQGRIKPAVRMTGKGKWVKPEAQEYLASKYSIGLQLVSQMACHEWTMLPTKTPLTVEIEFNLSNRLHTFDLDNAIKGVMDSANGIVYPDDRWIDGIKATRKLADNELTIFTVRTL